MAVRCSAMGNGPECWALCVCVCVGLHNETVSPPPLGMARWPRSPPSSLQVLQYHRHGASCQRERSAHVVSTLFGCVICVRMSAPSSGFASRAAAVVVWAPVLAVGALPEPTLRPRRVSFDEHTCRVCGLLLHGDVILRSLQDGDSAGLGVTLFGYAAGPVANHECGVPCCALSSSELPSSPLPCTTSRAHSQRHLPRGHPARRRHSRRHAQGRRLGRGGGLNALTNGVFWCTHARMHTHTRAHAYPRPCVGVWLWPLTRSFTLRLVIVLLRPQQWVQRHVQLPAFFCSEFPHLLILTHAPPTCRFHDLTTRCFHRGRVYMLQVVVASEGHVPSAVGAAVQCVVVVASSFARGWCAVVPNRSNPRRQLTDAVRVGEHTQLYSQSECCAVPCFPGIAPLTCVQTPRAAPALLAPASVCLMRCNPTMTSPLPTLICHLRDDDEQRISPHTTLHRAPRYLQHRTEPVTPRGALGNRRTHEVDLTPGNGGPPSDPDSHHSSTDGHGEQRAAVVCVCVCVCVCVERAHHVPSTHSLTLHHLAHIRADVRGGSNQPNGDLGHIRLDRRHQDQLQVVHQHVH
jgi:hypothetical protein